jgi:hypothetical protein
LARNASAQVDATSSGASGDSNAVLRELIALVLSYAGIVLVLSNQITGEEKLFAFGALLIFGSALCYATYLVAGSQMIKRVGSMRFTARWTEEILMKALFQYHPLLQNEGLIYDGSEERRAGGNRLGACAR